MFYSALSAEGTDGTRAFVCGVRMLHSCLKFSVSLGCPLPALWLKRAGFSWDSLFALIGFSGLLVSPVFSLGHMKRNPGNASQVLRSQAGLPLLFQRRSFRVFLCFFLYAMYKVFNYT